MTDRELLEMAENTRDARRAMFMDAMEKRNAEREKQYLDALTMSEVSHAWWAFNAALDCVVIELPEFDEWPSSMANDMNRDCRTAIESTNLGIKVK